MTNLSRRSAQRFVAAGGKAAAAPCCSRRNVTLWGAAAEGAAATARWNRLIMEMGEEGRDGSSGSASAASLRSLDRGGLGTGVERRAECDAANSPARRRKVPPESPHVVYRNDAVLQPGLGTHRNPDAHRRTHDGKVRAATPEERRSLPLVPFERDSLQGTGLGRDRI